MKKHVVLVLVLAAVLFGALPAAAAPVSDLTNLAQYFPGESSVFVALRTDDAYIQQLDSLWARVASKLPSGVLPPFTLKGALDQGVMSLTGSDFATSIRPWLGDVAAFGTAGLPAESSSQTPYLLAATLKDRKGAEAFFDALAAKGTAKVSKSTQGGFTVYSGAVGSSGALALSDNLLLLANDRAAITQTLDRSAKLNQSQLFTDTLALLPTNSYDILIYVDSAGILAAQAKTTGTAQPMAAFAGTQVFGLTVQDDRSLIVDIATKGNNLGMLNAMGVTMPNITPVDPAFAAYIPADASLVLHSTSIKSLYDVFLQAAKMSSRSSTSGQNFDQQMEQARAAVQQLLGLDLDKDIVDWMTGDYAAFVSYNIEGLFKQISGGNMHFETFPAEFGLVVKATDPAKAKALSGALGKALVKSGSSDPSVKFSQEKVGGVDAIVIAISIKNNNSQIPLEIVLGANDKVFVIATRKSAESILSGAPGLDTAASFKEAGKYLLGKPTSVWYMDKNGFGIIPGFFALAILGPRINRIFNNIVADLQNPGQPTPTPSQADIQAEQMENQQLQLLMSALNLVSSGSITTESVDANGSSRIRLVLTLAE
jgi:hypothetical protein